MITCSTCKFWAGPYIKGEKVACRRFPPKTDVIEANKGRIIMTVWPLTSGMEWCGEHKPKVESGQDD